LIELLKALLYKVQATGASSSCKLAISKSPAARLQARVDIKYTKHRIWNDEQKNRKRKELREERAAGCCYKLEEEELQARRSCNTSKSRAVRKRELLQARRRKSCEQEELQLRRG